MSHLQEKTRGEVLLAARLSSACGPIHPRKACQILQHSALHRGLHGQYYYHRPEVDRIRELCKGGFSSDAERLQFYACAGQNVRLRREVRCRDLLVFGI